MLLSREPAGLTVAVPPSQLILLQHWAFAGNTLIFPFIFQLQLHNLLFCQALHVGWQRDTVFGQLRDLCTFTNTTKVSFITAKDKTNALFLHGR